MLNLLYCNYPLLGNPGANNDPRIQTAEHELELQKKGKVNAVYEDLSRFTTIGKAPLDANDVTSMEYEAFEPGHAEYVEFMLSEYCWEDHGCDLVNHFLPGTGDELDDEFIESLSITDWR